MQWRIQGEGDEATAPSKAHEKTQKAWILMKKPNKEFKPISAENW